MVSGNGTHIVNVDEPFYFDLTADHVGGLVAELEGDGRPDDTAITFSKGALIGLVYEAATTAARATAGPAIQHGAVTGYQQGHKQGYEQGVIDGRKQQAAAVEYMRGLAFPSTPTVKEIERDERGDMVRIVETAG
jgi:hypothetical protein